MRRIFLLNMVLFSLAASAQAPSTPSQPAHPTTGPAYYDTFDGPWIDQTKWMTIGPWGAQGTTLECVREVQHGRLRLEIRNVGLSNSDSGFQFADSPLPFANPNSIFSITSDVQLGRVNVIGCPTNLTDQPTRAIAKIGASWFNTGSLNPADDVTDDVVFWVDASDPSIVQVLNWLSGSGLGVATPIGNYPLGTQFTATNTWDKTNHRFITSVEVKGEPDSRIKVVVPYSVADTALPVIPYKQMDSMAYSLNCTTISTFAEEEVFFDNVLINRASALR